MVNQKRKKALSKKKPKKKAKKSKLVRRSTLSSASDERAEKIESLRIDLIDDIQNLASSRPDSMCPRGYYRKNGKFTESDWEGVFGTFPEFQRAAGLKHTRTQQKILNKLAIQDDMTKFRKYYHEQVAPWDGKYVNKPNSKRMKTVLIASDIHDREYDPFAWAVFVDACSRMQPDIIAFNGDVYDMYEFSRFDKDMRKFCITERFDHVKENIFAPVRDACPNAEIWFIEGNHEHRLVRYFAGKAPEVVELLGDVMGLNLKDIFGLEEFAINYVSKADLAAVNVGDINNELSKNYKIFFDGAYVISHDRHKHFTVSGTSGHNHHPYITNFVNLHGRHTWMNTGHLCQYNADYIDDQEGWMKAFGTAHIDIKTKEVQQQLTTIANNFTEIGGKFYFRS